jgi:8-oxo-dGTP diphosphatase
LESWVGCAAICVNEKMEVLMVRGKDSDLWAIPSGGLEIGETPEICCIREVKEETGYDIKIIQKLFTKKTEIKGTKVKTFYFEGEVTVGEILLNDPDGEVIEVDWKSLSEIKQLKHAYPEDLESIVGLIKRHFPLVK